MDIVRAKKFVLDTVRAAGPNPCPPIVVGVGIGGTFDRVAALSKQALLRRLDMPHPDPYYAEMERSLLAEINALGIGPQGRGRFNNAEPTIWNGEDLDIPTFLRRNISLDV